MNSAAKGAPVLLAILCGCGGGLFDSSPNAEYSAVIIESVAAGAVEVTGLNESGWVTGITTGAGTTGNFLWRAPDLIDLGTCSPVGVNNHAQIACNTPTGPALWEDGVVTPLAGTDTMTSVRVTGINDSGHVAGGKWEYVFLWRGPNNVQIRGSGGLVSIGRINNQGDIAISGAYGLYPKPGVFRAGATSVSLYGTCGRAGSLSDVNEQGHAIGSCEAIVASQGGFRPAFWASAAGPDTLNAGAALDLNNADDIVGQSEGRAVRWRNLARTFQDDISGSLNGLSLVRSYRINDRGQIAAVGRKTNGQVLVILNPTP